MMPATTADLVNEFIALDLARKAKEDDIDKLKEQLALLEAQLLERFENAGQQSFKSKQGVTVYIHRQLWAGAADGNAALLMETLRAEGLGVLVKESVNTQTLSAYVRECAREAFGKEEKTVEDIIHILPARLQPAIQLTDKFSLRTRR
jgi:hypothetical protein